MAEIIVGNALSDVNRADLPRNLRVPERLADYIELYETRLNRPSYFWNSSPKICGPCRQRFRISSSRAKIIAGGGPFDPNPTCWSTLRAPICALACISPFKTVTPFRPTFSTNTKPSRRRNRQWNLPNTSMPTISSFISRTRTNGVGTARTRWTRQSKFSMSLPPTIPRAK